MEGVVDHHMRRTLNSVTTESSSTKAIDSCVTEFIRVTDHLLPTRVFMRSCPELWENHSFPVHVQLLGSNPEALALNARKVAKLGAPAVDLNFGCPAKTVNKNRGGACLLDDTALLEKIVSTVRNSVPPQTPVSVKIRLGYENRKSYLRNATAIERAGANELVVHARSKADGYRPPAYWHYIKDIQRELSIPVIANGEIWSVSDYEKCRDLSGCEDIMLGRGLLAQPDLAFAIKAKISGQQYTPLAWANIAKYLYQFYLDTCHAYPAKYRGNRVKQWLHYLQRNYTQAEQLFTDIKQTRDGDVLDRRLKQELHSGF